MWPFKKNKSKSYTKDLESTLLYLESIGIKPATPHSVQSLVIQPEFEEFNEDLSKNFDPELILCILGGTGEIESDAPLSNNVFYLDTECICDHGDYVALAKRLTSLTHGILKFDHMDDYIDFENNIAWFEYDMGGKRNKWTLQLDSDWLDTTFFTSIQNLIPENSKEKFMCLWRAQDLIISFGDENLRSNLSQFVGKKFSFIA